MKHIRKNSCPHIYSNWVHSVAGTDKARWDEVPIAMKRPLLDALISEQGWLCAYTMRRIESTSSHVEHIKPQSRCRADLPGSDLEYGNLVACFPADGMREALSLWCSEKGEAGGSITAQHSYHPSMSIANDDSDSILPAEFRLSIITMLP